MSRVTKQQYVFALNRVEELLPQVDDNCAYAGLFPEAYG